MATNSEPPRVQHLNVNTYVSVGLLVILLGGFGWIIKGQNDARNETIMAKIELTNQIKEVVQRVNSLEAAKNSWTSTDMFKWAVHLQQANSDPKKLQTEGLKVPEPEVISK